MLIFKRIQHLENHLKSLKKEGSQIGFVPTMGALHKGHILLLNRSKKDCDVTVCSIFVNPTQFNEKSDFDKYPNTIRTDIEALSNAGCEILFLPSVKEMYPNGPTNNNPLDFGFLSQTLEGEYRPGHFDGMAQIVEKLLQIVQPDKLFMGQKDFQQQLIVNQLIKKRGFSTKLVVCNTTREKDGLAMSSRNMRLSKEARELAVEISKTLKRARLELRNPDLKVSEVRDSGFTRLSGFEGIQVEYFEIRNAQTLKTASRKSERLVALVATNIGGVRLIDNYFLN
jgi:pantoate--beta-alanine ligase